MPASLATTFVNLHRNHVINLSTEVRGEIWMQKQCVERGTCKPCVERGNIPQMEHTVTRKRTDNGIRKEAKPISNDAQLFAQT